MVRTDTEALSAWSSRSPSRRIPEARSGKSDPAKINERKKNARSSFDPVNSKRHDKKRRMQGSGDPKTSMPE
jgi:hypothetical protein